jgi:uncharacterized membrane protein YhdT
MKIKHEFKWTLPIVVFLLSGWLVAGYFAFNPGEIEVKIISPLMYLYIFVVSNAIAWLIATMIYLKGEEE